MLVRTRGDTVVNPRSHALKPAGNSFEHQTPGLTTVSPVVRDCGHPWPPPYQPTPTSPCWRPADARTWTLWRLKSSDGVQTPKQARCLPPILTDQTLQRAPSSNRGTLSPCWGVVEPPGRCDTSPLIERAKHAGPRPNLPRRATHTRSIRNHRFLSPALKRYIYFARFQSFQLPRGPQNRNCGAPFICHSLERGTRST